MEIILNILLIIALSSFFVIPFLELKWKGIVTIAIIIAGAVMSGMLSYHALAKSQIEIIYSGNYITGAIPVRIDSLSAWFMMVISLTFITGAFYGFNYLKAYKEQHANIALHCVAYILTYFSLIGLCIIQNSLVFLWVWELMALGSFTLVIFEHYKRDVIKAGINFLIQSHICVLLLLTGFIWVASYTNSYDFKAITAFSKSNTSLLSMGLFFCFFAGFAIKAGFVPFHTWLPHAHPAAPSHISGVMSGVLIKIGIYGILRMLFLIQTDYIVLGYFILFISVISGVYGVMLAIVQHNLKKLLAYHSVENIGIIGIGIGLGTLGMGTGNSILMYLGFAGALLHTLNHSLFKSLLFFSAGNVYQQTHTINIEHLGGIIKKMPHTAILFLLAALAICGLPPFNGFVSEFLIYFGMFTGIQSASFSFIWAIILSLFSLALIGGLAILCFTKAFGTIFLGTARSQYKQAPAEVNRFALVPLYFICAIMLAIGIFPEPFIKVIFSVITLISNGQIIAPSAMQFPYQSLQMVGIWAMGFVALAAMVFFIRKAVTKKRIQIVAPTWGCGYTGDTKKMQYTASSFVKSYSKLTKRVLNIEHHKDKIEHIFPSKIHHQTHPYDKIEKLFIDKPLKAFQHFINRFAFMQNGSLQFYILYGIIFISVILLLPLLFEKIIFVFDFLKNL